MRRGLSRLSRTGYCNYREIFHNPYNTGGQQSMNILTHTLNTPGSKIKSE